MPQPEHAAPPVLAFADAGRLPAPADNTAIAIQTLAAQTAIEMPDGQQLTLTHTVLEGHRFAVRDVAAAEELTSWGLPFGVADRAIAAGEYLANATMLEALALRRIEHALPRQANFTNRILDYQLDKAADTAPALDPPPAGAPRLSFQGIDRGPRGIATRNYIAVIGTTSRQASFAREVAHRAGGATRDRGLDGVVAIAHTEGAGAAEPNNRRHLLRALAGFVVHPNVGAALIADDGHGAITNADLEAFLRDSDNDYAIHEVPHRFLTVGANFAGALDQAAAVIAGWREQLAATARTEQPIGGLTIALQCGGSDAFSGVSGNPLAAAAAREIIRHGGAAILAETDELIGAESYIVSRLRERAVGERFLQYVADYKRWAALHGHTAEDNPSGGNRLRGLYNITLKSLGAAMKKDPAVRVESAIDYAEPLPGPGYHFMNSPGNDLESVAGEVASGANLIYFITGNGSITNFPLVPTIKIVTTTRRYELLPAEMDVNAGAYLDGTPMAELTEQLVNLSQRTAGGERSKGELAGHSQVQLWRDWRHGAEGEPEASSTPAAARPGEPAASRRADAERDGTLLAGKPLAISLGPRPTARSTSMPTAARTFEALITADGPRTDQIGLILPTSLCSGQIARLITERLEQNAAGDGGSDESAGQRRLRRYVALPHTEGCGVSGGASEELYTRAALGFAAHPLSAATLMLEHGCERTHNDYFCHQMAERGLDPDDVGWASVQLDGGIAAVTARVLEWFQQREATLPAVQEQQVGWEHLRVGIASDGPVADVAAAALGACIGRLLQADATVVLAENAACLGCDAFFDAGAPQIPPRGKLRATLAYAQAGASSGLHLMETPTAHFGETVTGLGATGVEVVIATTAPYPGQAHPMIPVLQITGAPDSGDAVGYDVALATGDVEAGATTILERLAATASRRYVPAAVQLGATDFQVSRGRTGISM